MVLTVLFAFSICGNTCAQNKNFILVIDPGHGGEDPGAPHGRLLEKNLNLEVALALGKLIESGMPGVDVLYTRKDDRAVGLADRGNFANKAGADLFLSIHANANKSSSPRGSETYVMGMDKNEANLEVAKLENEVIKYEEDYTGTYAGFDPSSPEMSIIFGMLQYVNFESSLIFARLIQKHYGTDTALADRGAKQGPFAVLWKPTMPRVLTEMGFISNSSDRGYMFSEKGKQEIVKALYGAFREYKELFYGHTDAPAPATSTPPAATPPAATPPPATKAFYIQLSASRTRISTADGSWGPYRGKVVERVVDGWHNYRLGPYSSSGEAAEALKAVRRTEFRDAFIVKDDVTHK
jgi:N-acetylmuramoyl-L-alanine amidase